MADATSESAYESVTDAIRQGLEIWQAWGASVDQFNDWMAGSIDGGPNGDGRYPMTNRSGQVKLVPCPALLLNGITAATPYDLAFRYDEQPGASQVLDFYWLARPLRLPANLIGTQAHHQTGPLQNRTLSLRSGGSALSGQDGALVATLQVTTDERWVFTMADDITLQPGTLLKLVGADAVDGALQGVYLTLRGEAV